MAVTIEAPARLHLGFLDLGGERGRVFGSIGVAIEQPRYVLEVRPADRIEAHGEAREECLRIVERVSRQLRLGRGVRVHGLASIPRHVGFGSGTQLELSLASAIARLFDLPVPMEELARMAGRGRRSGVGIATFEKGGFVVDAGRRQGPLNGRGVDALPDGELPLVVVHHPVPDDWFFVIVTPEGAEGVSGDREERIFMALPPMGEHKVGKICRLTLMKVIPGVLNDDIRGFGEAITEIQILMGEHFAPYQGGMYATPIGKEIAEFALKQGAHGVGQSSWGPTMFALVRGEGAASTLAGKLKGRVGEGRAAIFYTRASNRGATWRHVA